MELTQKQLLKRLDDIDRTCAYYQERLLRLRGEVEGVRENIRASAKPGLLARLFGRKAPK